jgi:hypothetical protein
MIHPISLADGERDIKPNRMTTTHVKGYKYNFIDTKIRLQLYVINNRLHALNMYTYKWFG